MSNRRALSKSSMTISGGMATETAARKTNAERRTAIAVHDRVTAFAARRPHPPRNPSMTTKPPFDFGPMLDANVARYTIGFITLDTDKFRPLGSGTLVRT